MKSLPTWRRCALAVVACLLSALVFRAQIALALVTRGDDFLTRGDVSRARQYYLRAVWLDDDLTPAVDRFAFFGAEQRTSSSLRESASVATRYLIRHPDDGLVLADRALCFELLKEYGPAARDFGAAAAQMRSAKYFTFAGWARYRLGDRKGARTLWGSALHLDASYSPALGALRRTAEGARRR